MNTLNFAARVASAAAITYQALLVLLIFLRPDLDPSWHTISEWAIGRYGWVMTGAFLISGASDGALLVAIHRLAAAVCVRELCGVDRHAC